MMRGTITAIHRHFKKRDHSCNQAMNDARGISRIFETGQLIARCCVVPIAVTADGQLQLW